MPDISSLSPADVLTPVGFPLAAALVTGLVEIGKRLAASILTGREQLAAAALALLFVTLAVGDVVSTAGLDALGGIAGAFFTFVLAWYGILRIAMGIHDDAAQRPNSLTGPTGAG